MAEESSRGPISEEIGVNAPSSRESSGEERNSANVFSTAALAAAVAAIGLPLMKVGVVQAATISCGSDAYSASDIGDLSDCTDCAYRAIPSDCMVIDANGGAHWGSASPGDNGGYIPPGDGADTPSDGGGGCGGCGSCGSCGGDDQYGGSCG